MFFGKFVFFFFSSRRRHTIYIGDWSSDVCSSDLGEVSVALRDRHRDAYLARAEQIAPHLESAGQHAWLDTLEVESANLAAALDHAAETDGELALRMCVALMQWWRIRGRFELADAVYVRALAAARA